MSGQAVLRLREAASEKSVIPLRPYQEDAVGAVVAGRGRGLRRMLIAVATGGGKTHIATHLIRRFGMRAVFLVHRDELVRQSVAAIERINPGLTIGVCKAERDELGADVIVASAQTLGGLRRLERLHAAVGGDVLFISDECHHDPSPTRRRIIETLDPAVLVGLTATPNRADGVGLGGIYEEIVYRLDMLTLIAMNKLAPLRGLRIETETELDGVHTRAGEFAEDELANAVDNPGRNRLIVESWRRHAGDRRRTVVFCVNVAHARHVAEAFREDGVEAEVILGNTPADERLAILDRFHRGLVPVLVNVNVLTEGYDEPAIDCVLMCRPTKSHSLYVQAVGRAARLSPETGKRDALVIDFVDNSTRHSLITLPSLAGAEEVEVKRGAGGSEADRAQGEIVDLLELAQRKQRVRERAAIAVNLFGASPYVWRTVGGYHMARAAAGGYLTLVEEGDGYVPARLTRDDRGPALERLFDRPLDMETAMSIAESMVGESPLTRRDAHWRQASAPPTPRQVELASRLGIAIPPGVSKVQLSELIDERMFVRQLRAAQRRVS